MTRKERERAEAERKRRWRQASAVRSGWTMDQHAAELERLAEETEAMILAGDVTRLPDGWAKGATENSIFAD